ncbi:hypothetical protein A3E76_01355 [Candidatus Saccharibacteria bacterium RIFCSPHIGHO2_12_FULL_44_22]|nr:MAG: hypothetical protein A3E76_01355 [Candidatus Saccharibacteria bacterium RIFCSPHIGHO2_12_FULL_44_22]
MTVTKRGSRVINSRTDESGLLRSFQHGIVETVLPGSIEYSKDLAEYFDGGVNLTIREVDGESYASTWFLSDAIINSGGRITEFLVAQEADVEFEVYDVSWCVRGVYYLRFFPGMGGWAADRQCVYQWEGGDVDHLEDNHIAMSRLLSVDSLSPYFSRLIYQLAQGR